MNYTTLNAPDNLKKAMHCMRRMESGHSIRVSGGNYDDGVWNMDEYGGICSWCRITGRIERPELDRYDVLEIFMELLAEGFCLEIIEN